MGAIEELIANNAAYTARHGQRHLDVRPSRHLAIVACMDSRLDIFAALGLKEGEAHILRNAGGAVTDDVVRSLAISQRRLGTTEILLAQHSGCGMSTMTDEEYKNDLLTFSGLTPPWSVESFTDVDASVRQGMMRIRRSPFLKHHVVLRGFVADLGAGGLLREVF